jgi:effector-binding domain-containing protein
MTPTITQSTAQRTAVIHVTCPRHEIQRVMGAGVGELMQVVGRQGVAIAGPWFTHHSRRPTETFDFDIGVPVAADVKPEGRVRPGTLAARRVAHAIHIGGYDGLARAWGDLERWVAASGHGVSGDLWEVYALGPESTRDPSQYRTELFLPLAD